MQEIRLRRTTQARRLSPSPGLAASDVERLLQVISEAYGFDNLAEFRAGVLEILADLVPYDAAGYDEIGFGESFDLTVPPFDPELLSVFAELAHQNPLVERIRRTGDGRPYRISDVMDRNSFHQLALYQRFYRHVGVEYQVAFTLVASRPLIIGMALTREHRDFSDTEVDLLSLARPHLMQAYRHAEMLGRKTALIAAMEAGLDTLGHNVVVLDADGRVDLATPGAQRLLGKRGLTNLPGAVTVWLATDATSRSTIRPLLLAGRAGDVLVRALPSRPGDRRRLLLIESAAGVPSAATLAGLGLTPREAETLASIAAGRTPDETAGQLGIARRTIDKHLQNIYAKLSVSTLSEAITAAWTAIGLPPPSHAVHGTAEVLTS